MDASTSLPDHWTEGSVESNGIRLHYTRTGPGTGSGSEPADTKPPLVIAHGVFDDGPCRTPLAEDLESEYDVIAYDARGHGRSDAPESGYAPADRAADLVGLIDALELENPILFGHSMGGDTVAAAAADHPDLPRAVVVVDPAALLDRDRTDPNDRSDGVLERIEWWHDRTKAQLLEEDDELRGHVEKGEERLASLLADARLRVSPHIRSVFEQGFVDPEETYPKIAAPTLILRADVDEERRKRDRELAGQLPSGRLVHVEGTGHTVFRDDRKTATAELRTFLEDV